MTEIRYDTRQADTDFSQPPPQMAEDDAQQTQSRRAEDWYDRWRKRIAAWLKRRGPSPLADLLLLLPDMFMLAVGLLWDKRVGWGVKLRLVGVVAYVVFPLDFLPEMLLGVLGLADDAGLLAISLYSLRETFELQPEVIRDHWRGDQDALAAILSAYSRVRGVVRWMSPLRRVRRMLGLGGKSDSSSTTRGSRQTHIS